MLHGYLPAILGGLRLTLRWRAVAGRGLRVRAGRARWPSCRARALARGVAGAYTTLIRGLPELVLMLLIFYGGQIAVNQLAERAGLGLHRRRRPSSPAC